MHCSGKLRLRQGFAGLGDLGAGGYRSSLGQAVAVEIEELPCAQGVITQASHPEGPRTQIQ